MPIYEYRCSSCGHQQEFLQKWSDEVLKVCTSCGKESFSKMLSAAGFHLKGSGWYATDFKGGSKSPAKAEGGESKGKAEGGESKGKSEGGEAKHGCGACAACG